MGSRSVNRGERDWVRFDLRLWRLVNYLSLRAIWENYSACVGIFHSLHPHLHFLDYRSSLPLGIVCLKHYGKRTFLVILIPPGVWSIKNFHSEWARSPQIQPKCTFSRIYLGSDLLLTLAAAMLGSVGEVNVNCWPSHSVSICLAGSFAIQICGATLSKCFPVVPLLLLYRAAYRVSCPSFSWVLKHPGRYKREIRGMSVHFHHTILNRGQRPTFSHLFLFNITFLFVFWGFSFLSRHDVTDMPM